MSDSVPDGLPSLIHELREFVRERDWEQFHDPKNLVMALVSEAGELAAEYRWVSNDEADAWSRTPANFDRVSAEVADVGISLMLFCERTGIDLPSAIRGKLAVNRVNYPVEVSRGRSDRPR